METWEEDIKTTRIDHIKHILPELKHLPNHQKEIVYYLARHIIQICSINYEKDIKEICTILNI